MTKPLSEQIIELVGKESINEEMLPTITYYINDRLGVVEKELESGNTFSVEFAKVVDDIGFTPAESPISAQIYIIINTGYKVTIMCNFDTISNLNVQQVLDRSGQFRHVLIRELKKVKP